MAHGYTSPIVSFSKQIYICHKTVAKIKPSIQTRSNHKLKQNSSHSLIRSQTESHNTKWNRPVNKLGLNCPDLQHLEWFTWRSTLSEHWCSVQSVYVNRFRARRLVARWSMKRPLLMASSHRKHRPHSTLCRDKGISNVWVYGPSRVRAMRYRRICAVDGSRCDVRRSFVNETDRATIDRWHAFTIAHEQNDSVGYSAFTVARANP